MQTLFYPPISTISATAHRENISRFQPNSYNKDKYIINYKIFYSDFTKNIIFAAN